jgi:hypothetical protein
VDYERITSKYTGVRISPAALVAHHRIGGIAAELATAISQTAHAVHSTDAELARITTAIDYATTAVTSTIAAEPDQRAPSLNPLGELQIRGPRVDALIGIRDAQIEYLRLLVRLWQQLPTADGTATIT